MRLPPHREAEVARASRARLHEAELPVILVGISALALLNLGVLGRVWLHFPWLLDARASQGSSWFKPCHTAGAGEISATRRNLTRGKRSCFPPVQAYNSGHQGPHNPATPCLSPFRFRCRNLGEVSLLTCTLCTAFPKGPLAQMPYGLPTCRQDNIKSQGFANTRDPSTRLHAYAHLRSCRSKADARTVTNCQRTLPAQLGLPALALAARLLCSQVLFRQ